MLSGNNNSMKVLVWKNNKNTNTHLEKTQNTNTHLEKKCALKTAKCHMIDYPCKQIPYNIMQIEEAMCNETIEENKEDHIIKRGYR